jgi:hypothetical protein
MDDFESIVDGCLKDIAAGRETSDSCLQRYPAQAARLAPLLEVAERLRQMPAAPCLPLDKRRVQESRYLKRAAQLHSRATRRAAAPQRGMWRRGWMPVIAAFLICLILVSAITAAPGSMPGDVLYPVKRVTEQVRLALTSEPQQAALHLNLAQERLAELRALAARHEVPASLLAEISAETTLVVQQIPSLPPEQQQALLTHLTEFNDQNLQVLQSVAAFATGDTQASVQAALADSTAKQDRAKEMFASIKILPDAPPDGEQGPPLTPAGIENRPTQVDTSTQEPTIQPSATGKPKAQPTPQATKKALDPPKPTPKIEHTPPEQSDKAKPTRQPHEQPTKKPPKK